MPIMTILVTQRSPVGTTPSVGRVPPGQSPSRSRATMHLADDFAGGEIAHQALGAGVAEGAVERAADLARHAQRAALGVGDVDAFDLVRQLAFGIAGSRSSHLRVPSTETCSATTSGRSSV